MKLQEERVKYFSRRALALDARWNVEGMESIASVAKFSER